MPSHESLRIAYSFLLSISLLCHVDKAYILVVLILLFGSLLLCFLSFGQFLFLCFCSNLYLFWLSFHYLTPCFCWFLFVACNLDWSQFYDSFQIGIDCCRLVVFLGISFLRSCFWVIVLLLREVCFFSLSNVCFSSPFFIFSSFFCSSCPCFGFSFEGSTTARPFFTGAFRRNDVIGCCFISLSLGEGVVEIILLHFVTLPSILQSSVLFCFCGVIFWVVISVSCSSQPCAWFGSPVCDRDLVGTELSSSTECIALDLEACYFLRTILHRWLVDKHENCRNNK